ncbi:hypothetical protein TWF696_009388 [Orbilia brochopaga]|uniref:histone acetyltransferase n=1 Tax=Orbilia brochopaga TaxID=3140254 RepID=A0AAV9UJ02_9PEZI
MQTSGSINRRHSSPSQESGRRTRSKSQSESQSPEEHAARKSKTSAIDHAETAGRKRDGMRSARSRAMCEQKPENIQQVCYGGCRFDVEHTCSGYAKELIRSRQPGDNCLYVCHKCFKYSMDPEEYYAHQSLRLEPELPTGALVHSFGGGRYHIYEVDGADQDHQPFLQRMCLFGKLFIQNKSIWYEFDNFVFYVLLERHGGEGDDFSYCGFFSKEKVSYDENNLSCIILFPPYRSQGLGSALIDLSYHISRATGRIGGPEKPISELGQRGYTRYWTKSIASSILALTSARGSSSRRDRRTKTQRHRMKSKQSRAREDTGEDSTLVQVSGVRGPQILSAEAISQDTGIAVDDILETLSSMDVIKFEGGKPRILRAKLRVWASGEVKR